MRGIMVIKGIEIGAGAPCICVPVVEAKKDAILAEFQCLSESPADMLEWRVDAFDDYLNLNAIREILEEAAPIVKNKIFLYTFRTKQQGGNGAVNADQLNDIHEIAAESGWVDLLDMEFFEEEKPLWKIRQFHKRGIKVIASHHDFEETPDENVMKMLLEQMRAGGADLVKIAVMPKQPKDVLSLLSATSAFHRENKSTPIITMSMGKLGIISRLCGETFGSAVTFASHKAASAPGQMNLYDVSEVLKMLHEGAGGQN